MAAPPATAFPIRARPPAQTPKTWVHHLDMLMGHELGTWGAWGPSSAGGEIIMITTMKIADPLVGIHYTPHTSHTSA